MSLIRKVCDHIPPLLRTFQGILLLYFPLPGLLARLSVFSQNHLSFMLPYTLQRPSLEHQGSWNIGGCSLRVMYEGVGMICIPFPGSPHRSHSPPEPRKISAQGRWDRVRFHYFQIQPLPLAPGASWQLVLGTTLEALNQQIWIGPRNLLSPSSLSA